MTVPSVVGKTCPYCQTPLKPDANIVICQACGMPHHQECWMENGRCTTFGCSGTPQLVSGPTLGAAPPVQPMGVMSPPAQPMTGSLPPPPQMAMAYTPMQAPVAEDMYLEGNNTIIIRAGTSLPAMCLVTGRLDNLLLRKRKDAWVPSWVWIIFIFSILIGAIVSTCVQKTGQVQFYLEKECHQKRVLIIIGNWVLCLALLAGAIAALANEATLGLGFFLLLACILVPVIIYFIAIQLYTVAKIDNGYMWFRFRKPEMAQALYAAYLNQHR